MDASAFKDIGKGLVGFCIACVVIAVILTASVTSCIHKYNDNPVIQEQQQETSEYENK